MKLLIKLAGCTYEVDVEVVDGGSVSFPAAAPVAAAPVAAPAAAAPVRVAPPAAPAQAAAPTPTLSGSGEKTIKAPIPGNIVGVKVKAGDTVKAHEPLVVLEAMKMETPIASATGGKIKAVLVEVGSSVKQGQVLVEFE
ncbi:MAG: biotin/lipoyl-containing protein [Phycisphaerae bacterium]